MATEWFYTRDGKKTGPLSSVDLKALADSGKLLPTDLIWKEGMTKPRPASEMPKLFAGGGTNTDASKAPSVPAMPSTSFMDKVKEGARTAATKAEVATLTGFTLPNAYAALGNHLSQISKTRSNFPRESAEIDEIAKNIEQIKAVAASRTTSTFAEKAKAVALAAKELAEVKALELRLRQALIALAQTAYDAGLSPDVSPDLVQPIRNGLVRLKELQTATPTPSPHQRKRWLTRKRVVIGATCFIGLIVAGLLKKPELTEQPNKAETIGTVDNAITPAAQAGSYTLDSLKRFLDENKLTTHHRVFPFDLYVASPDRPAIVQIVCNEDCSRHGLDWVKDVPTLTHFICEENISNRWGRIWPTAERRSPLAAILRNCKSLRCLDLRAGIALTPMDIHDIARGCPRLESLRCQLKADTSEQYADGLPYEAIVADLSQLKSLKHLAISIEHAPTANMPSFKGIANCRALQYLEISGLEASQVIWIGPKDKRPQSKPDVTTDAMFWKLLEDIRKSPQLQTLVVLPTPVSFADNAFLKEWGAKLPTAITPLKTLKQVGLLDGSSRNEGDHARLLTECRQRSPKIRFLDAGEVRGVWQQNKLPLGPEAKQVIFNGSGQLDLKK